jgi:amidohydrolase
MLERAELTFASKAEGEYVKVSVMHACGHDTHIAMLMDCRSFASIKKKTLKERKSLFFQPAEEDTMGKKVELN